MDIRVRKIKPTFSTTFRYPDAEITIVVRYKLVDSISLLTLNNRIWLRNAEEMTSGDSQEAGKPDLQPNFSITSSLIS